LKVWSPPEGPRHFVLVHTEGKHGSILDIVSNSLAKARISEKRTKLNHVLYFLSNDSSSSRTQKNGKKS
jgi:hypothetical protein